MKISFNLVHTGKFPEEFNSTNLDPKMKRMWWKLFNGGFTNHDYNIFEASRQIEIGHPFSSQHFSFRKKENFICGQHVAIDIDSGGSEASLDSLAKNSLVKSSAALIYSTPSHKDDFPKSRIFFQLDRPIYQVEKYSLLLEAINIRSFGKIADTKCHDPARFFFGSNGIVKFIGGVLEVHKTYEDIIAPYCELKLAEQKKKAEILKNSRVVPPSDSPLLQAIRDRLINKIYEAGDGEKHFVIRDIGRTFGGYIAAGYYDEDDITNSLKEAISNREVSDLWAAYQTIEESIGYGKKDPIYIKDNEYTIADIVRESKESDKTVIDQILLLGSKKYWA